MQPTPTPSERTVMVSLRFLELVALLLPVLAIVMQALFATYSPDPSDRSRLVQIGLFLFGLAVLFLVTVAINLVGFLIDVTPVAQVESTFDTLVVALFLTLLAILVVLADFYREPPTSDDDRDAATGETPAPNSLNTTAGEDTPTEDTDGE